MQSSRTYTSDFREHFSRAEKQLLRRRFLWFSGVLGSLGALMLLVVGAFVAIAMIQSGDSPLSTRAQARVGEIVAIISTSGLATALYLGTFLYALIMKPSDRHMMRMSIGLVIADGLLNVVVRAAKLDVPGAGLFSFFITHVLACAILPWRVSQALIAGGVVITVSGLSKLFFEQGLGTGAMISAVSGYLTAVPGSLIAWLRHSQRMRGHQFQFLQSRYGEVRRELTDARRIHEAMFPVPLTQGPVRFTYRYQPMRQIGGDFLHVSHAEGNGSLSAVLLDVTGHGIPAALTVNRLFGELQRIFAEDPGTPPGVVLSQLNRYVHLTMSEHSVFVTGLCARVSESGLEYANAGHPPAFLLTADGRLDQLDSTGMVLGAVGDDSYFEDPRVLRFEPGDRLIAYTDGATEARDGDGRMLSVTGLQAVLAGGDPVAEGSWPVRVLDAINEHRAGAPEDDTLVIELYRPVAFARSETTSRSSSQEAAVTS